MARDRVVKVLITGDASGFKKAVGEVDRAAGGLSGKLKGIGAGIGIAALGKGLLNTANRFKDAALAANDFATASGLAGQDAARFIEVASDLGVEAKSLSTAMGKLAKGLGANEDKWKKYGVAVAHTADGAVDVKRTFLNAIDVLNKTENPLKRNTIASELFGKSWQDLAPLIELGADGVSQALAGVSDAQAKVGDPQNVEKAKKFRDAMDELSDKATGLGNNLAEGLIPALTGVLGFVSDLDPKIVAVGVGTLAAAVAVGKLTTALQLLKDNPTILALTAIALIVEKIVEGIKYIQANKPFTPVGFTPEATARINERAATHSGIAGATIVDPRTGNTATGSQGTLGKIGGAIVGAAHGIAHIFGFASGGVVPGAMGAPQLALVHGGEEVLTPGQRAGTVINIYMPNARLSTPEDARRLAVEIERERSRQARGGKSAA